MMLYKEEGSVHGSVLAQIHEQEGMARTSTLRRAHGFGSLSVLVSSIIAGKHNEVRVTA